MEHLLPAQVEELRVVFDTFARPPPPSGGVGDTVAVIPLREMYAVASAAGLTARGGRSLTEADVAEVVAMADTRGRGSLAFEDFVHVMTAAYLRDASGEEELAAAFTTADADGDGRLSADDIAAFVDAVAGSGAGSSAEAATLRARLTRPAIEGLLKEAADGAPMSRDAFNRLLRAQIPHRSAAAAAGVAASASAPGDGTTTSTTPAGGAPAVSAPAAVAAAGDAAAPPLRKGAPAAAAAAAPPPAGGAARK